METIISQIEQFLLKNAWGVIIAGIIASILGTLLCYLFRKLLDYLTKKFKIHKKKQKTVKYLTGFYRGAAATYSKTSSYRQTLLVGDYILDVIHVGLTIIVYILIAGIFMIMSKNLLLDMAIIFICSFMIYPQYKKYKEIKYGYELTYDLIFGKDFTQKCIDGAFETLEKNKEENKQTSEKEN